MESRMGMKMGVTPGEARDARDGDAGWRCGKEWISLRLKKERSWRVEGGGEEKKFLGWNGGRSGDRALLSF
jgi:hypothetical protein